MRAMNASETFSWNRSDIEFTNTRRGSFQLNGLRSRSGRSRTFAAACAAVQGRVLQPRSSESRSA